MPPRRNAMSELADAARESGLQELQRAIGRIEGKIDTFIAQMKVQDERTGGIEARLRGVEGRQHWYSGAGAIAGMILGAIGIKLKAMLGN